MSDKYLRWTTRHSYGTSTPFREAIAANFANPPAPPETENERRWRKCMELYHRGGTFVVADEKTAGMLRAALEEHEHNVRVEVNEHAADGTVCVVLREGDA